MNDEPRNDRQDAPDEHTERPVYFFEHERLDCYRLAAEVAAWLAGHQPADRHLRDQSTRAAQSVVLNIAEGCGRTGRSRRHHYSIARGSAAELCAALDLMPTNTDAQQRKLRRVGMMLWAMTK